MAKAKSFADKVASSSEQHDKQCPNCGEVISMVKLVAAELKERTGATRFRSKFIGICKCNANDLETPVNRAEQPAAKEKAPEPEEQPAAKEEAAEKKAEQPAEEAAAEEKTEQPVNEEAAADSGDEKSG